MTNRTLTLGCFLSFLLFSPVAAQTDSVPERKTVGAATYVRYFVADGIRIGAAPAWWRKRDWLKLGILTAGAGALVWQDDNIREIFQRNRGQTTNQLADILRPFGAAAFVEPTLIGTFGLSTIAKKKKLQALSLDAWEASQFALTVTGVLKLATGRARPFEEQGVWKRKGLTVHSSFPSGHATLAFVLAAATSEHFPKWWVKTLVYGIATGVALSRLNDDEHFASDVLVGAAVGTAAAQTIFKRNESRRKNKN